MKIIYLDQNKWIELARAALAPSDNPDPRKVLEFLVAEVSAGRVGCPLTAANLYETFKIGDPHRRTTLAYVQATLSQGIVFKGRQSRLTKEVSDVLRSAYNLPNEVAEQDRWFLSNLFWEAMGSIDDPRVQPTLPAKLRKHIQARPAEAVFRYLTELGEIKVKAVEDYSAGSNELKNRIEARRQRDKNESLSFRRRIYSATLLVSELETINDLLVKLKVPAELNEKERGRVIKRLVEECPIYFVEREIVLRLEAQQRAIHENDFRDLQTFTAVVPYADVVIAEKQFVNLATQAGLGDKYDTVLSSNLADALKIVP